MKLHVDSILKSYTGRQILTDIYLSLEKGEVLGLLGRNGTGKSTLLNIIFGVLSSESRFVKIGENRSTGLFSNRKEIAYLPQFNFLPSHLSIETIVNLFCDKNASERVINHPLVKPHVLKKPKAVSYGELRIIQILILLYSKSTFVLLDEPFNGVAPIHKDAIKEQIKALSTHKGILLTDHDYRNVLDIATRTVLLYDGGLKNIKEKKELIEWGYILE